MNFVQWYSDIMLGGYIESMTLGDAAAARGEESLLYYQDACFFANQCTQANRELQRRGQASILRRIGDMRGPLVRDDNASPTA